jgi:hypothetical protein
MARIPQDEIKGMFMAANRRHATWTREIIEEMTYELNKPGGPYDQWAKHFGYKDHKDYKDRKAKEEIEGDE